MKKLLLALVVVTLPSAAFAQALGRNVVSFGPGSANWTAACGGAGETHCLQGFWDGTDGRHFFHAATGIDWMLGTPAIQAQVKADGIADDTAAVQNAVNAATGNTKVIQFPCGSIKITSTIQINNYGLRFLGCREGRPGGAADGATRLEYYGTGPMIQLGTQNENGDTGHTFDAADYNGYQGFSLENMALAYKGSSTSALLNGLGTYGTGTYGLQDWRGGDMHLTNVRIENFQYGFWGIQSDFDYFEKLEIIGCSVGVYLGPRSDQATLARYMGNANDTAMWIDDAHGVTVNDSQLIGNGVGTSAYPVKIGSAWGAGASGITFRGTWFEVIGVAINAFVDIADGDTQTSSDIYFVNSTFNINPQGSPPTSTYFLRIDHATNVVIDGTALYGMNFSKPIQFVGSGSASVLYKTAASMGVNAYGTEFVNSGTGSPAVNEIATSGSEIRFPGTLEIDGQVFAGPGAWFFFAGAASGGAQLINSPNLDLQTAYWNGSSSVALDNKISAVADNTSGATHIRFSPNNVEQFKINSNGTFQSVGVAFASLPSSPSNGQMIYCSDCTIANPCASGGTGAIAKRLNSVWVCN